MTLVCVVEAFLYRPREETNPSHVVCQLALILWDQPSFTYRIACGSQNMVFIFVVYVDAMRFLNPLASETNAWGVPANSTKASFLRKMATLCSHIGVSEAHLQLHTARKACSHHDFSCFRIIGQIHKLIVLNIPL